MTYLALPVVAQRVLVVDDDPVNRQSLVELLTEEGFAADAVADGQQAFDWMMGHAPETGLVLLDLMMPNMNGDAFLFAKEGEASIRHVPVVLMTASGPDACDGVREHHQVRECMHKPVTLAALLAVITGWTTGAPALGPRRHAHPVPA